MLSFCAIYDQENQLRFILPHLGRPIRQVTFVSQCFLCTIFVLFFSMSHYWTLFETLTKSGLINSSTGHQSELFCSLNDFPQAVIADRLKKLWYAPRLSVLYYNLKYATCLQPIAFITALKPRDAQTAEHADPICRHFVKSCQSHIDLIV